MWNPFLELFVQEKLFETFVPFVNEADLAKTAFSCLFSPDVLCCKEGYLSKPPDSDQQWKVRQYGAFPVLRDSLGLRPKDGGSHHDVWLHLDFADQILCHDRIPLHTLSVQQIQTYKRRRHRRPLTLVLIRRPFVIPFINDRSFQDEEFRRYPLSCLLSGAHPFRQGPVLVNGLRFVSPSYVFLDSCVISLSFRIFTSCTTIPCTCATQKRFDDIMEKFKAKFDGSSQWPINDCTSFLVTGGG